MLRNNNKIGFSRPAINSLQKRRPITQSKDRQISYVKRDHNFWNEDSKLSINYFPKRSEFLKLRKTKEQISKKKAKINILTKKHEEVHLNLFLKSPQFKGDDCNFIEKPPNSVPVTPTIYDTTLKNLKFLKKRAISFYTKKREISTPTDIPIKEESIPLSPW